MEMYVSPTKNYVAVAGIQFVTIRCQREIPDLPPTSQTGNKKVTPTF
jgi:hypothetical protein